MPQNEITGNRPKNYSTWHRPPNLPNWCFQTDGDWFEQRKKNDILEAVAYIETIQIPKYKTHLDYPIWDSKRSLAKQINEKMEIPSFFVWHPTDCSYFYVKNINSNHVIKMNENEYKELLLKL